MSVSSNPEQAILQAEDLLARRELLPALAAFQQAEDLGAPLDRCAAGRWMASMLLGDFEFAWKQSDAIRLRGGEDPHRFWQGEDLQGKRVILRCLHGFGDAVQMLAYLPRLARLASSVIVEVPPRLLALAPCFRGIAEVITWGEEAPPQPPEWDVQLEIMELPYLFRTTVPELPLATEYLQLPADLLLQTRMRMGSSSRLRIGLVWAAGEWNPSRAIPLSLLEPLLLHSDLEFWNLQGASASAQAAGLPLRDASALCGEGILPLASVISQLDLVLTVDTLAAHLSGALGKPAWVLLQHAADWRWLHDTDKSPWYPSLRLFRQPRPEDWAGVVAAVQSAMKEP